MMFFSEKCKHIHTAIFGIKVIRNLILFYRIIHAINNYKFNLMLPFHSHNIFLGLLFCAFNYIPHS